jgi:2-oxoglutarate ferredoxin oxidoreductase subunit beta
MAKETLFKRPESLTNADFHYCPGCSHSIVHRLIAELVDELGIREKVIGVFPVGCTVTGYNYFRFDSTESAHGRAPAAATGIKRVHKDKVVFAYQGDGDLASIGLAETIHAANRGENFTVIFINNTNYGMTGGQMAPTTLPGQKTTTCPAGRDIENEGSPMKMAELIGQLERPRLIVRTTVADLKGIRETKKYIKKAFEAQMKGKAYSFIEVLSNCATNWGMKPVEANKYILENIVKFFPPGVIRDEIR